MRTDRLLALLLILASLFAALSNGWTSARSHQAALPALADTSKPDVALIDIYGTIADSEDGASLGGSGASAVRIIQALREAERDQVKGIVLRINSPGGTAAASQMVNEEVMRLRRAGKIKIVTAMGDLAASGGYFIACAADHIVANPSTTTGSIGVILHLTNVQKLMNKLGVGEATIQSGVHKDILSPFRPMRPDERALLQGLVNDTYAQFLAAVAEGRRMPLEKVRPLADGRVFTGRQALAVGLVDSLGNYEDAIAKAGTLAGIKGEPTVRDYTNTSFFGGLWPRFESRLPGWFLSALGPDPRASWNRIPLTLME